MQIPLVSLKTQYAQIKDEILATIHRVLDSGDFILGEELRLFEKEWAQACQVSYAIGAASGTAALHMALLACGIGPGDEVVTVPFTFIATTEAISYTGATIRFVDIDPETYTLDATELKRVISNHTKAIVPVHLYGHPADMDPIISVAKEYGLKVIEDAAQAHLARYRGRIVGTISDVGCFSFFPVKNLGAYGDAGMVITNTPEIAEKVLLLRNHGRSEKYEHRMEGYNYRLDTLQAAILRVKLRHLEVWTEARRNHAAQYAEQLMGTPSIILPVEKPWARHVYHLYVVRSDRRLELQQALRQAGIETGIHYPLPLHLQPAYQRSGYPRGTFPHAEQLAAECLSLPMFPELTEKDLKTVTATIVRFSKN